jgi:hypothetical protein
MFAHLQVIFHATDCDKPIRLWSPFKIKVGRFEVYLITSHLYTSQVPRCRKTITLKLLVYEWKAWIKLSHFLHRKSSLAIEAYAILSQKQKASLNNTLTESLRRLVFEPASQNDRQLMARHHTGQLCFEKQSLFLSINSPTAVTLKILITVFAGIRLETRI